MAYSLISRGSGVRAEDGQYAVSLPASELSEEGRRCKIGLQFDDIDQFVQIGGTTRSVTHAGESETDAVLLNHGVELTDIPYQGRPAVTAFAYHKLIVAHEGGWTRLNHAPAGVPGAVLPDQAYHRRG